MTKISRKPIDPKELGFYINNLWSVFTLIDSKDEIKLLFKDLFTHTEYKMLAKRLEIARRLIDSNTYESIMQNLKVTERTISNVSNTLERDGRGLHIAYNKLSDLEKLLQCKRDVRQDILEHKQRPELPEALLVKNLVKVGFGKADQILRSRIRQTTAKKILSI
jgi:uncharacterized protein YerC